MNAHSLVGKLTVLYGILHQIKKLSASSGEYEIKAFAEDGMFQLDMLNKEMAEDLLTRDPEGAI